MEREVILSSNLDPLSSQLCLSPFSNLAEVSRCSCSPENASPPEASNREAGRRRRADCMRSPSRAGLQSYNGSKVGQKARKQGGDNDQPLKRFSRLPREREVHACVRLTQHSMSHATIPTRRPRGRESPSTLVASAAASQKGRRLSSASARAYFELTPSKTRMVAQGSSYPLHTLWSNLKFRTQKLFFLPKGALSGPRSPVRWPPWLKQT